jgi:hypothetical protein
MHGNGTLESDADAPSELMIRIMNTDGQIVRETRCNTPAGHVTLPLDVSGLEPGIYILECVSGKGVWRKKIVIT